MSFFTLRTNDVITNGSDGWRLGCFLFLPFGSGHQTDVRHEQLCRHVSAPRLIDVQRQEEQSRFWKKDRARSVINLHNLQQLNLCRILRQWLDIHTRLSCFCRCGTHNSYSYSPCSIIIVFLMSTSYEVIDECADWLLPHLDWSCLDSGLQAEMTAWCSAGRLPWASSRRIIMLVKSWKVSTPVDTLLWQWASKVWWWRRSRSAFKPGSSNMTSTISLCFITAFSAQHKNSFVLLSLYESSTKHLRDHFVSRCAVSLANSLGSTLSLGWAGWGSERGNTGSQWTKILLRQDLHSVRWLSSCFSMSASSARFSFRKRPLEKETLPRALSLPIPEREDEQKTMFIAFKIQGIV